MTKLNNWPLLGLSCVTLAGCMGGGDDVSSGLSFSQQIALATQLADTIEVLEIVAPASLPTTGSANYAGNLGLSLSPGTPEAVVMYGQLDMVASFADNTVTGDVTDFVDSANDRYSGQFTLENGQIDPPVGGAASSTLTADIGGSITSAGNQVYTPDATLRGDFFGEAESHVAGVVEGDILVDDTRINISNGAFAAAR